MSRSGRPFDFRLKAEATRFFLGDSWLPASAGRVGAIPIQLLQSTERHYGAWLAAVNGMLAEYCQTPPTREPTRT